MRTTLLAPGPRSFGAAIVIGVAGAPTLASPDPAPAHPSVEPISTDRPDFTETPDSIAPGRAQLETGYTYTLREDTQTHTLPEALLRIGLFENVEARIAWAGWVWERAGGATTDGAADLNLGFKVHLLDGEGLAPSLGFIGQTSVPVGEAPSGEDDFVPEGKLAWAYDLTDSLALAGNLNLAAPVSDNGDRYPEFGASVSLAVGLTDRLGMFVEYFGAYPAGLGPTPEHSANTGLTLLLTPDMQIDARIGAGLSDAADDLFAGVGLSVRF